MPESPALPSKLSFWRFFLLLGLSPLLSSCQLGKAESQPMRQTLYVFGTVVNIELYTQTPQQAEQAIHQVEQRFQQFNREWHAWEKGGIIARINQAIALQKSIIIPANVKAFILKSQQLSQRSQGYFDPGIGGLIALWGFHADEWQGPPPSKAAIQAYLQPPPSIMDITFQSSHLSSRNPQVSLDFGGNAKGLALDIAMETLQKAGIENAVVNIGGDMRIHGHKPGGKQGQPWRIGIQNPQNLQAAPIGYVELQGDESIVTSGTYQRYYQWQGQRYSHLLNPKTGYPIDHEGNHFISVTVIHPDATTADAAATALIVAGPKHWQKVAQQMGITQALLIDSQGTRYFTDEMQKRFFGLSPNE